MFILWKLDLSLVQSPSHVWFFSTLWTAAHQTSLSFTIFPSLLKLMSAESVMPSSQLMLCCPLLLLPSMFLSIRVFSSESALQIRLPEDWSFSFSISLPVNIQGWFSLGLTGLISLLSKGLSKVSSSSTDQKHQFFGAQSSLWSNSCIRTWLLIYLSSVCNLNRFCTCSVQFSRSVVSDSLRPYEPQHVRPPCPSPILGVHPNPCPSNRWCHPIISSSVVPFSSCPQSFPASGSF